MEGLTPASADDLPPIGELIVDQPFWRHPAWGLAREGVAHLRIWVTATDPPRHLAVITEIGFAAFVTESAGRIWAELVRRHGPSLVLLAHHPAPTARAWRPWIWSASAPMAARTGLVFGRLQRTIPVTPGWSCGWPPTGTRSSAGRRAGSTHVMARATDCLRPDLVRIEEARPAGKRASAASTSGGQLPLFQAAGMRLYRCSARPPSGRRIHMMPAASRNLRMAPLTAMLMSGGKSRLFSSRSPGMRMPKRLGVRFAMAGGTATPVELRVVDGLVAAIHRTSDYEGDGGRTAGRAGQPLGFHYEHLGCLRLPLLFGCSLTRGQ